MQPKSEKAKLKKQQHQSSYINSISLEEDHVLQNENELTCGIATFAYVCSFPGTTNEEKVLNAESYLKKINCVQTDRRVNSAQMKRALNHYFGSERSLVTNIVSVSERAVIYLNVGNGMFHWVVKKGDLIIDPYFKEPYLISELTLHFSRAYNLD